MGVATRVVSAFFLVASLCIALASITSLEWAVDRNVVASDQHVYLGLQKWQAYWTYNNVADVTTGAKSYDDDAWNQLGFGYMGSENSWKQAGMAALVLGAIGISLTGIAMIVFAGSFAASIPTFSPALISWLAGCFFVLGAIIYEGVRPAFHGDFGYQWGYGLYLTAAIFAEIAAFVSYAGSGTDAGKSTA